MANNQPARTVVQRITVDAGPYVLSWFDQTRDASGDVASTAADEPYAVTVYDTSWKALAAATPTASVGDWSSRRQLAVMVPVAGAVYVAFAASTSGDHGSVLVGDVQFEAKSATAPSPYIDTTSSLAYVSNDCAKQKTAASVQAAFTHRCEAGGCFYELATPLTIDTTKLASNQGALTGQLAGSNFNYRHMTIAVNLVGTAVKDCTNVPQSSCYGGGFIQYSLMHDAEAAAIVNFLGLSGSPGKSSQHFTFGIAEINHAKALAAEKYITTPIGSSDQGLLGQDGLTKAELRGRPLDGNYRLRIWDSPALQWNHLEDIQFVLNYQYWAPIKQSQGTK
jgi:hypothetical protein